MDQSYSFWADLLNKFHTSSDAIQALWLIVVPALVFGVTWCVTRMVRDVAVAALRPNLEMEGLLIHGVIRDKQAPMVGRAGQQQSHLVIPGSAARPRNDQVGQQKSPAVSRGAL